MVELHIKLTSKCGAAWNPYGDETAPVEFACGASGGESTFDFMYDKAEVKDTNQQCDTTHDGQPAFWCPLCVDAYKKLLGPYNREIKGKEADDWRDDDSPQAETGFGVCS